MAPLRYERSCSLSLSCDDCSELVALGQSTLVATESSAGDLDSILLFLFNSSPDHFHHFAFVRSEAADFAHDSAHSSNTLVQSAFAVRPARLLRVGIAFGLGHDETVVETNVNTTLL